MKHGVSSPRWVFLLLLALCALGASGCASTEPENASVRPWNAPKGWETGIPGAMTEGH
jgi:hypothetical protein